MKMNKFSGKLLFLALILTFGLVVLAGCGANDQASSSGTGQQNQETQQPAEQQETQQPAEKQEPAQQSAGQQEPAQAPQQVQEPEQKQEPAQEGQGSQTTGSTASSIPKIPHQADAKTDCLACHKDGVAGAPKTPHPERKDQCFSCHPLAKQ